MFYLLWANIVQWWLIWSTCWVLAGWRGGKVAPFQGYHLQDGALIISYKVHSIVLSGQQFRSGIVSHGTSSAHDHVTPATPLCSIVGSLVQYDIMQDPCQWIRCSRGVAGWGPVGRRGQPRPHKMCLYVCQSQLLSLLRWRVQGSSHQEMVLCHGIWNKGFCPSHRGLGERMVL